MAGKCMRKCLMQGKYGIESLKIKAVKNEQDKNVMYVEAL